MAFNFLTMPLVIEGILFLALLQLTYSIIHNLFLSPLRHFPGPFLNSITSLPFDVISIKGDTAPVLVTLHATYGPIVRVRPNELSVISGAAWKQVFGGSGGRAEFSKGQAPVRTNGHPGLADAPRETHRRYRRLLGGGFSSLSSFSSSTSLQGARARVERHVELLMRGLDTHGPVVDALSWFRWAAQDVVGDLAFGESFGCLEKAADHPWTKLLHSAMLPIVVFSILQNWGVDRLGLLLVPRSVREVVEENHQFVVEAVERRLALGGGGLRGDLLDDVVEKGMLEKGGAGLKVEELHNICFDLVAAGSDTTAHVLTAAVYELVQHPSILRDVTAEVRGAFASPGLIVDVQQQQQQQQQQRLPLINAVLSEALRLHHPAVQLASRVAPGPAGGVVGGRVVPAGTRVTMSPAVAFQSETHFVRAQEFVPERWLNADEFAGDNAEGVWQPFSAGPRNCIGMNLAWVEMRLVLVHLLWRFDLSRPKDDISWDGWVERTKTWLLLHPESLFVEIRRRQDVEMV